MASVVIGLGSNLDHPLQQLRLAVQHLNLIPNIHTKKYSSIYRSQPLVPDGAPKSWQDKPYFNAAIAIETSLSPQDLLVTLKKIEMQMGRIKAEKWAPRKIDLDILIYDNLEIKTGTLTLPHPELHKRPFAFVPLQEVMPNYDASFFSENILEKVPHLLTGPQVLGILNVTPDSFSDGNHFYNPDKALQRAKQLFQEGADIIDIGAESTRPQATLIGEKTEWERLEPVLQSLYHEWLGQENRPLISIDTRHAATVEKAMALMEINLINDQSQAAFAEMAKLLKDSDRKYVAMHHLNLPPEPDIIIKDSPINILQNFKYQWLEHFEKAGLSKDQLILDPGIGFGKTKLQQFEIIRQMHELTKEDEAWLVGHSRKSFLSLVEFGGDLKLTREISTAMISVQLARSGVKYLRVHEPATTLAAIRLTNLLH